MKNIFNTVALKKPAQNRFDLSHDFKMSFSMGELVPTCCMEVLPGDQVTIGVENFLRFMPLISPVMHRIKVTTHYFFVPNRILWPEWEQWITGNDTESQAPFMNVNSITCEVGSLMDYLGYPTGAITADLQASPLPIAAYLKIFDEYYRDQNLQTPKSIPVNSGENDTFLTYATEQPLHRAWQHDYFTSALPFAQKGDSVQIPLTTAEDVVVQHNNTGQPGIMRDAAGNVISGIGAIDQQAGPAPLARSVHADDEPATYDPNGSLVVDIQADATDINTLRFAFRLQEWLEKNARAGTRYVENLLAHWGVRSSDARLQRPEYIGGSKQNMVISEVLATAQSTADNIPVGNMAGHGISVGGGNRFNYRAEEHGYIIGIINVQPDTAYQQGLHRSFSRFNRLDYAWPTFAHIGEQEVKNKEIFANGGAPEATFGYVPRYSEYKFMNSRVAGELKNTLDFWHLGRIFTDQPTLSEEFISCFPSTRIFAVTESNEDHIISHVMNNIQVVRKLPRYGIPTI